MAQNKGQESFSQRGQKGGEAALNTPKVSAAELAMYLKGASFPMNKQKLAQVAKQNGAPQEVIGYIEGMSGRGDFNSPVDVEKAFSKEKANE
jgi:hypothetical protein